MRNWSFLVISPPLLTLLGCAPAGAPATAGSSAAQATTVDLRAEEAAIRALVNRRDGITYTDDAVFWSGAFPRPLLSRSDTTRIRPFDARRVAQRRNVRSTDEVRRLEVAAAGDMAYEFSDFTLSYDLADTQQRTSFTGSVLRVWKKVNGQWRVVAAFMRPHDVPFASRDTA